LALRSGLNDSKTHFLKPVTLGGGVFLDHGETFDTRRCFFVSRAAVPLDPLTSTAYWRDGSLFPASLRRSTH